MLTLSGQNPPQTAIAAYGKLAAEVLDIVLRPGPLQKLDPELEHLDIGRVTRSTWAIEGVFRSVGDMLIEFGVNFSLCAPTKLVAVLRGTGIDLMCNSYTVRTAQGSHNESVEGERIALTCALLEARLLRAYLRRENGLLTL